MGMLDRMGLNWQRRAPEASEWRLNKLDKKQKQRELTDRILAIEERVALAEKGRLTSTDYDRATVQLGEIIAEAQKNPVLPDVAGNAARWRHVYEDRRSRLSHH